MILILFTTSHPYSYGAERTFLEEEIPILVEKFGRVILVPRYCRGERYPLPEGVEVDESYARLFSGKRPPFLLLLRSIFSPYFFKELIARPSLFLHPKAIAWLVTFLANAILTRDWVKYWLMQTAFDPRELVFYTYWFDDASMGIGLFKKENLDICVISRAHGYDLFEERYSPPYFPCRMQALSLVDMLFLASEAGASYMGIHYPRFKKKYRVARLGVKDFACLTKPSADGVFRVLSCSSIVPVKRIDLLFKGIIRFAEMNPDKKIHWTHFGEGVEMKKIIDIASNVLLHNLSWSFPGNVENAIIMSHYKDHPVDIFMNVSSSEGGPVSMQEAISYGIPVLATAVGGNVEIVTERNGSLLPPNPGPDEVAAALGDVLRHREEWLRKRNESRRLWQEKYNATLNFTYFADALISLRSQRG